MSTIVTVYSPETACHKCKATKMALDKAGITYEEKPVDDDVIASAEELGLKLVAPIVCASVDGQEQYWSDFRPDRIKALAA